MNWNGLRAERNERFDDLHTELIKEQDKNSLLEDKLRYPERYAEKTLAPSQPIGERFSLTGSHYNTMKDLTLFQYKVDVYGNNEPFMKLSEWVSKIKLNPMVEMIKIEDGNNKGSLIITAKNKGRPSSRMIFTRDVNDIYFSYIVSPVHGTLPFKTFEEGLGANLLLMDLAGIKMGEASL